MEWLSLIWKFVTISWVRKNFNKWSYGWVHDLHLINISDLHEVLNRDKYEPSIDQRVIEVPLEILFSNINRKEIQIIARLECDGFLNFVGSSNLDREGSCCSLQWSLTDKAMLIRDLENIDNNFTRKYEEAKGIPIFFKRKIPWIFLNRSVLLSEMTRGLLKDFNMFLTRRVISIKLDITDGDFKFQKDKIVRFWNEKNILVVAKIAGFSEPDESLFLEEIKSDSTTEIDYDFINTKTENLPFNIFENEFDAKIRKIHETSVSDNEVVCDTYNRFIDIFVEYGAHPEAYERTSPWYASPEYTSATLLGLGEALREFSKDERGENSSAVLEIPRLKNDVKNHFKDLLENSSARVRELKDNKRWKGYENSKTPIRQPYTPKHAFSALFKSLTTIIEEENG